MYVQKHCHVACMYSTLPTPDRVLGVGQACLGAFSFWGPKFFRGLYKLDAETADLVPGAIIVVTAIVGTVGGGTTPVACFLGLIYFTFLSFHFFSLFTIHCLYSVTNCCIVYSFHIVIKHFIMYGCFENITVVIHF